MNAPQQFFSAITLAVLFFSGCQSWQGANFPMQNGTRVPPPGTGTYQLPSGYYNNNSTSSLTSATSNAQFAAGGNSAIAAPASNFVPASTVTSGYPGNFDTSVGPYTANDTGPAVVTASAVGAPLPTTAPAQFSPPDASSFDGASASLSDDGGSNVEAPSLQWQQFGEH